MDVRKIRRGLSAGLILALFLRVERGNGEGESEEREGQTRGLHGLTGPGGLRHGDPESGPGHRGRGLQVEPMGVEPTTSRVRF